ncbi:dihydrolipoamide acetyltransferase family protein [Salipaludibacillus sp. HK11]|uniref:dihydrolipoamide acetyltransferase family protein n=1 Tax=Salipaludibacillus sp. HK11 TaxID=3394320 RepID=UPI0039FD8222
MATEITMPQLGESVTEGTLTKWLVKKGDYVNKYDPLAEVMTDKVNAEVPSLYTGFIKELVAEEDETIEVGGIICILDVEKIDSKEIIEEDIKQESLQTSSENEKNKDEDPVEESSNKKRYSPAVLRLSQEHAIDLNQVNGSGRGGRITRKDLYSIIENGQVPKAEITEEISQSRKESTSKPIISKGRTDEIPLSSVRKTTAQNMVKAKQEAPHAWMMIEVDVTEIVRFREKVKTEFLEKEGMKLTFLPFFMKATIDALKKYPEVNAKWAGDKIIRHKDVHLSMAVANEDELFVPVIRHADEKNIKGLARELATISKKVRSNSLKQEDVQGGTFTLNNTGSFGSIQSQPIINMPQAAILTVESIVKRPVVLDNDAIAIRHMVNLCLSLDHRVLDGLICGKFMAHIKQSLENMNEKTVTI